jgi:hypothetical protein
MARKGELNAKKDVIPERKYFEKDLDELFEAVHGACKARIQLGFDTVPDEPEDLNTLIRELQVQNAANKGPLITNTLKPPGSVGRPQMKKGLD